MTNKLILGILILLVVLSGLLGYSTFTLNRQVDSLNERFIVFQGEQQAVSDNVNALRAGTESSLRSLGNELQGVSSQAASLDKRLASAENAVGNMTSQVGALDARVVGLSGSIINADAVYQRAVKATVRITDGTQAIGSGFIYSADGRIVTAYHVVDDLSPIYIMFYNGKISKATVSGYCPYSDIAVLKLDVNPSLDPLPLADSSKVRIGEPVVAIGSPGDGEDPLALRDTMTSGIISQVNRSINIDDQYYCNLFQVDAAINFGNSGGPLVNSKGEVIGVVNARIDPSLADGISYAIASNKVKRVADSIIAKGSFAYPWIGVGISDITPLVAVQKSLDSTNGAVVGTVVSNGPAYGAGIKAGDIIVSVDGIACRNTADLTSYLGEFKSPGDTVAIEIIRGAEKLKISVVVGARAP